MLLLYVTVFSNMTDSRLWRIKVEKHVESAQNRKLINISIYF